MDITFAAYWIFGAYAPFVLTVIGATMCLLCAAGAFALMGAFIEWKESA